MSHRSLPSVSSELHGLCLMSWNELYHQLIHFVDFPMGVLVAGSEVDFIFLSKGCTSLVNFFLHKKEW